MIILTFRTYTLHISIRKHPCAGLTIWKLQGALTDITVLLNMGKKIKSGLVMQWKRGPREIVIGDVEPIIDLLVDFEVEVGKLSWRDAQPLGCNLCRRAVLIATADKYSVVAGEPAKPCKDV